ncbi:response regulator transcription factor [Pampinifervens florentissimum]|uniref:response regulator transcription factor n=1 Tax=Pampinifervens florentissimum TaxID=1632019 RepID=UPI0013B48837|nr:response regulator transcription factor [Hydrogenobacter sp. T-8]QID33732.1 response regulator transcription factor [Hydrogenobacter sp. T-8]
MRVLLVEDDQHLGRLLLDGLSHEGYEIDWVRDGYSAVNRILEEDYDLVLLDIMLPKMDGIKVCKRIREVKDIPIIMLTAKGQIEDKVEGLSAGADDYITKPFSFKELLARIGAVLRRYKKEGPDTLRVGELELRLKSFEVYYRGKKIPMTQREFKLLRFLAERVNTAVSREEIYLKVWGYSYGEGSNVVDVYIKNIRTKLEDKDHRLIRTVRGYGYMMAQEDVSKG